MPIPTEEPVISVGIVALPVVEFELKGEFVLAGNPIPNGKYRASLNMNGEVFIGNNKELINDKTQYPFEYSIPPACSLTINPVGQSSTFILKRVTIGIGFHWEQQEDQEFEGGLLLLPEGNQVRAINLIPLEGYLRSVISSEMSAMNDQNLLNAHAIVSRSWLLAQLQNRDKQKSDSLTVTDNEIIKWYDREDHTTFDVCADDHCQRYQGITKIISAKALQAIEATRGTVLLYEEELCDARFSKCCGGISEDFENAWQPVKVPYLTAIIDCEDSDSPYIPTLKGSFEAVVAGSEYYTSSPAAYCNTSDKEVLSQVLIDFDRKTTRFFRWTVEYTQQELSELIKRKSGIDFGNIVDLQPLERGRSGRIIRLKITGTKKEIIVGKELEIRKWLSESHLYSSAFIVEKKAEDGVIPQRFIIKGAGWGHGVGMCQIGAAVMSKKGYTSVQILEHYFTGATIKKIYD